MIDKVNVPKELDRVVKITFRSNAIWKHVAGLRLQQRFHCYRDSMALYTRIPPVIVLSPFTE